MRDPMTFKAMIHDGGIYTWSLIQVATKGAIAYTSSIFTVFLSNLYMGNELLIKGMLGLYLIDFVLGLLKSRKSGTVSSFGLWRGATKLMTYALYLYVGIVIDTALGFSIMTPILITLIIIRDAISIIENLEELGVKDPTGIMGVFKRILNMKREEILKKTENKKNLNKIEE